MKQISETQTVFWNMAVAAYAGVVSLSNLIDQIKLYNEYEPVFLKDQVSLIESLQRKVCSVQNLIESFNYGDRGMTEAEDLSRLIADAAHGAEDVLETHVVAYCACKKHTIHSLPSDVGEEGCGNISEGLNKVIGEMEGIKEKLIEIKEKLSIPDDQPLQDLRPVSSVRSFQGKDTVMEVDDDIRELLVWLTRSLPDDRQHIAIVGMAGIGKTTLARAIYVKQSVKKHFDTCSWVVISQEYNVKEILLGILGDDNHRSDLQSLDCHEIGEKVWKHLYGRSYFIVLDDMWSMDAWDKLNVFLPKQGNGSRILLTTRSSTVANNFGSSSSYKMKLLDEDQSWNLFCMKVFGEQSCPPELERTGKMIAESCHGLPLSISVIGGLLAKSNMTPKYWESIVGDISAIVNAEDDERCMEILSLSYRILPIHLKPCFLYMGIFPEDSVIRVSELIRLWIAEGFLKPSSGKDFEETSYDYLKELLDRNLLFVHWLTRFGKIGGCKIHDLMRDFCLREAHKERFYCVVDLQKAQIPQDISRSRQVVIRYADLLMSKPGCQSLTLSSTSLRSLHHDGSSEFLSTPNCFRLLRVLKVRYEFSSPGVEFGLFNLRHIDGHSFTRDPFSSEISMLWNLQRIELDRYCSDSPFDIWEMPQLRRVKFGWATSLSEPQAGPIVLKNLHKLAKIRNFRCTQQVCSKMPNIKNLNLLFGDAHRKISHYHLHNFGSLRALQSLECEFPKYWCDRNDFLQNLTFPLSLKKLILRHCHIDWKDVTTLIGPNLEKLQVIGGFVGKEWHTVDGQFSRLRYLFIGYSDDLAVWRTESSHFPNLEKLVIKWMPKLMIPSEIGEIPTLEELCLSKCNNAVKASARECLKEQRGFGNDYLQLFFNGLIYTEEEEEVAEMVVEVEEEGEEMVQDEEDVVIEEMGEEVEEKDVGVGERAGSASRSQHGAEENRGDS